MRNFHLPESLTKVTKLSKIMALILFISLPFIGFSFGRNYQRTIDGVTIESLLKQVQSIPRDIVYVSDSNQPQPKPLEGVLEIYKSEKLGVSFSYFQTTDEKFQIKIKEIDNKIYLYTRDDYTKGKYIEVWDKNPTQTLNDAIQSKFLKNYSENNCIVKDTERERKYGIYNPDNLYSSIVAVGVEKTNNFSDAQKLISLCPTPYTHSNFVSYFVMNKEIPNKFAFVNLGHDNFSSYPELSWDMTINFTK